VRTWVNLAAFSINLLLAAGPVYAAEQITLRNGFEITCHHHARVKSKIRLFTSTTNDNYIEVAPADIASVEKVPDPPAPEPPPTEVVQKQEMPVAAPDQAKPSPVLTQMDLNQMLAKAGVERGLSEELARTLALETVLGTVWMSATTQEKMEDVVRRVASPNGTTEAGLAVLGRDDVLNKLVSLTIGAASRRGAELAEEAKAAKLASEATLH